MMTGPLVMAAIWTFRPVAAFVAPGTSVHYRRAYQRLWMASSSSATISVDNNVSRMSVLQTLLSKHGAPGSRQCDQPNDLVPVTSLHETPELVSSMTNPDEQLSNLHPYLFPIAKSTSSGNYICAYRNPFTEESDINHPWPIVEAQIGGPGMRLLALNSEHLMRRIACECDTDGSDASRTLVTLYNQDLGKGDLASALDAPYQAGAVEQLGYGVDKYVLLRVGPFPDLYQTMARQHAEKGDEQSSLIAAEAANGKLAGFGSTFRFYARLLASFPNRHEESRDAARMCLRLPLTTIGMSMDNFREVAVLGQLAEEQDSLKDMIAKLNDMYEKLRMAEQEEDGSKTPEQAAIDEASYLMDQTALSGARWSEIRPKLGTIFRSIDRVDMAKFVDLYSDK